MLLTIGAFDIPYPIFHDRDLPLSGQPQFGIAETSHNGGLDHCVLRLFCLAFIECLLIARGNIVCTQTHE